MKTIKNLKDFLKLLSAKTPWEAGRNLYEYTDCGPWTSFVRSKGGDVYYEDAYQKPVRGVIGVKLGSIVEGSDAEVTRDPLLFPFTSEQFESYVQSINDEASELWERDNN